MTRYWQRTPDEINKELIEWMKEEWPGVTPFVTYRDSGYIGITIKCSFTPEQLRTLASIVNTDAPDDGPNW